MSGDSEIMETNNLCTTEDAFEKFQADTIYEEEDFITLSDIVPPQPSVPDLSNELIEIPYDNEVVLSSTQNDAQPYGMSTEDTDHTRGKELVTQAPDNENDADSEHTNSRSQCHASESNSKTHGISSKREERRKNQVGDKREKHESPDTCENLGDKSQISNNQAIQDVHSTTVDKNGTESSLDISGGTNYPRRTRRERIPNTSKYPLVSETSLNKGTPGRRGPGRPKKVSVENHSNLEPDSTNTENNSSVHENLNNAECSRLDVTSKVNTGKRGRPRKATNTISQNDEIMQKNEPNKLTSDSDLVTTGSKIDISLNTLKKGAKKGRKKKTHSEPVKSSTQSENSTHSNESNKQEFKSENSDIDHKNTDKSDTIEMASDELIDLFSENKVVESSITQDNTNIDNDDDDDADDICLSKLKKGFQAAAITENLDNNLDQDNNTNENEDISKRNSNIPLMADFEYNIDRVVKEVSSTDQLNVTDDNDNSLLVEDTSKRPIRRKIKQTFKYDEDSDEDPFANVELSEDDGEPRSRKKGRCYSDDEYIPSSKRGKPETSSDSDMDLDNDLEGKRQKRKKVTKNSDNQTPKKRGRKSFAEKEKDIISDASVVSLNDDKEKDLETCLKPAHIMTDETLSMKPPAEAWAKSNEFENFIAQKIQGTSVKIKKVTSKSKAQSALEIPVIDQNKPKKKIGVSTQTNSHPTTSTEVQTSAPYDIPMKVNINLSAEQSQKACGFLKSVVQTTSELGQLMKEKSEDFMKKKINTNNVIDTFKMDYCVRKSFLLFKLAKHNLMQMEEDLAKQYEEFLKQNNLSCCREQVKKIIPKPKAESDSDCEIVEVKESPTTSKKNEKAAFNPKTVFLNKELSIKIAKKPGKGDKKLDIEGRHTVWINDSVMVKKVKPIQSFLAQDSRNKKPPDCVYVTEKMVSDFFEDYHRQKALTVCAPFINTKWSSVNKEYACYYFVKCDEFDLADTQRFSEPSLNNIDNANTTIENFNETHTHNINTTQDNNPKSLISLSAEVVCNYLHVDEKFSSVSNLTGTKVEKKQPISLFRLCYRCISLGLQSNKTNKPSSSNNETLQDKTVSTIEQTMTVQSLKTLCYRSIIPLIFTGNDKSNIKYLEKNNVEDIDENSIYNCGEADAISEDSDSYEDLCAFINDAIGYHQTNSSSAIKISFNSNASSLQSTQMNRPNVNVQKYGIKSLSSLCLKSIQILLADTNCVGNSNEYVQMFSPMIQINPFHSPKSLKCIVYESIKHIMYEVKSNNLLEPHSAVCEEPIYDCETAIDFTINSVNTLTEEAYHSLQESNEFQDDEDDDYEPDTGYDANQEDENEWASQVQMQELRTCVTPIENSTIAEYDCAIIDNAGATTTNNSTENEFHIPNNMVDGVQCQHKTLKQDVPPPVASGFLSTSIKIEPLDEVPECEIDPSIIKTESVHGFHGMTIIPESIITKREVMENPTEPDVLANTEPISATFDGDSFEQFVRANKMVRAIAEYEESDGVFSQSALRIKRQHEPDHDAGADMNMSLLVPHTYEPLQIETLKDSLMESSSDENKDSTKKTSKKKLDKKLKGRSKKGKDGPEKKNSTSKETPTTEKELNEPEKDTPQCSNEVAIITRRMREKIRQEEKKIESSESENETSLSSRREKSKKEQDKTTKKLKQVEDTSISKKSAESEIQCNNVDSTEQIVEKDDNVKSNFTGFSAIDQNEITNYQKYMKFVYDKIMPEIEENDVNKPIDSENRSRSNSPGINLDQPVELLECEPTLPIFETEIVNKSSRPKKSANKKKENKVEAVDNTAKTNGSKFTERNGWHCYSIDKNDIKLYGYCHIPLEKLPETFVETYLEYHDITNRDKDDEEVDRLTNLQSLNRLTSVKEGKSKSRPKENISGSVPAASQLNSTNVSGLSSPANTEHYDELTPSEDEDPNIDDEIPPPVPVRSTENCMAKDSLMDDHESDSEVGTHKLPQGEPEPDEAKYKAGPKSKTKIKAKDLPSSESLMLTADKMMNKELTLLHAPIVPKEEVVETPVNEPSPKEDSKTRKRSSRTESVRNRIRTEDDSSSEEEKQWVSTKEKLLKRMGKKEDASVDDAKRARLVTEFIERRGGAPGKRRISVGGRRSKKKFLEQQKQLRVLSRELFGEPTGGKRAPVPLFKGRRNIRKVIDKKSLARSTVLANMEEFERKRRLNAKQTMLRELHGCEEGVNVLVINDEVCLEYDFEQHRPIVTIHPFFTKVMKAHQYEGVKFMWDACFESLSSMDAGHPGGGCILAHCMGLGKTLQVLALLHTVLTHPRVGMQRVLVCCPLSTVLNWVDEIHKWIGPVTDEIKVFELSKLRKTYERAYQLEDWYSGGGIFIIGYELFRSLTTLDPLIDDVRLTIINKIRTALLDPGPDIIICDEGHLLKNDCSVLAVAMSRVVTKRRIILTGTPMQNNLREYYCMVNFVKPNLLGTYSEYSNRFENPIMNGQHRDSQADDIKLMKARTHILHKVLEGCLQRQEASVLYPYLPKKYEYTVFIPLTKCQWDLYKHYVHHYTKKSKQSVLKDFHILQKIWSHPQVLHNFQIKSREDAKKKDIKVEKVEDDLALEDKEDLKPPDTEAWWLQYLADGQMLNSLESSNKFVAVFRILHESISLGDKVLIFSTSLFCLDALEYFLQQMNSWSLGQEYYRLDGSVPPEVRQKWCREFNADNNVNTKLFLISTRAGCLGLNMTAANRVIILDTSWNPAHDIQSIFRVYRFGQKKDCYIYRLVAMGTMEQKIYERSVTKQAVACRVVDEQQIDRHYNMADLTELYRFDEAGLSVAGGVAVGVSDVVLLRVARDEARAVHAVHEHDSLLRGSAEPNLPEHERAAAWMQFQQEHAHKQMQNDIDANKAALARQKSEVRQQKLEERKPKTQVLEIKTEEGPIHDTSLLPAPVNLTQKASPWTRARNSKTIVQCRIPIQIDDQPGPSQTKLNPMTEEDMIRQITNILIKYNFTKSGAGPKQIADLVAKVKKMVQTGQPMSLGPGCDELSASIANVMMQCQGATSRPPNNIPPLTDVGPPPTPIEPPVERPRLSRNWQANLPEAELEPTPPAVELAGRSRRRAAIAAEKSFDTFDETSRDSGPRADSPVLLADEEWRNSDTDSAPETVKPVNIKPSQAKRPGPKPGPKSRKMKVETSTSIVLSDDEAASSEIEKPETKPSDRVILHPSLLSNQNFVKIVAHTYLAGNPMLDEDAATLAAQYSTFKALKEAESTGKPIDSGPIYDIAMQVLGKDVLKKLQLANPKTNSSANNAVIPKVLQQLGQTSDDVVSKKTAPSEPVVKKKIGPKSRVPKPAETAPPKTVSDVVPIGLVKSASNLPATCASVARDECILPDDEVQCVTPTTTPNQAKINIKPLKLKSLKPIVIKIEPGMKHTQLVQQTVPVRVSAGPAPIPPKQYATICLDSDEEDVPPPTPVSAPTKRFYSRPPSNKKQHSFAGGEGPVPVALTGPNSQPIPLSINTSTPAPTDPPLVPISLTGPDPRPVPISLKGPDPRPVPTSVTGPDSRPVPISLTGPDSRSVPISLTGPGLQPIPISLPGLSGQNMPTGTAGSIVLDWSDDPSTMSFKIPAPSAPAPPPLRPALVPSAPRPQLERIPMSQPSQSISVAEHLNSNIYLFPLSQNDKLPVSGNLTRVSAAHVPASIRMQVPMFTTSPSVPIIAVPTSSPLSFQPQTVIANTAPQESIATIDMNDIHLMDEYPAVNSGPSKVSVANSVINSTPLAPTVTPIPNKTQAPKTVVPSEAKGKSKAPSDAKGKGKAPSEAKGNDKALEAKGNSKAPSEDKDNGKAPKDKVKVRRSRKLSSSSSSGSDSSRPSTPDPLSILKDVVHIQAPEKPTHQSKTTDHIADEAVTTKTPKTAHLVELRKKKFCKNFNKIITAAKQHSLNTTSSKFLPGKSIVKLNPLGSDKKADGNIQESIDLTDMDFQFVKKGETSKQTSKKTMNSRISNPDTSKGKAKILNSQFLSPNTETATVVGTSKNIVLDGKSKAFTNMSMIDLTGQKSIQVTNVKTIPALMKKIKSEFKRTAPPADTTAPKKRKTELMTLKDFDIDDIDDIIELD